MESYNFERLGSFNEPSFTVKEIASILKIQATVVRHYLKILEFTEHEIPFIIMVQISALLDKEIEKYNMPIVWIVPSKLSYNTIEELEELEKSKKKSEG